jgi:hypothetical protein
MQSWSDSDLMQVEHHAAIDKVFVGRKYLPKIGSLSERVDSISADVAPSAALPRDAFQRAPATPAEAREQIAGKLLDHGRDA